jgi:hypothetical protein
VVAVAAHRPRAAAVRGQPRRGAVRRRLALVFAAAADPSPHQEFFLADALRRSAGPRRAEGLAWPSAVKSLFKHRPPSAGTCSHIYTVIDVIEHVQMQVGT